MGTWAWVQRSWSWKAKFKAGPSETYNWLNVFNQANTAACICQDRFSRFSLWLLWICLFHWQLECFSKPVWYFRPLTCVSSSCIKLSGSTFYSVNSEWRPDYHWLSVHWFNIWGRKSWTQREEAWISTRWKVQEIEKRKNTIKEKYRTCWDKGVDYFYQCSHRLDLQNAYVARKHRA